VKAIVCPNPSQGTASEVGGHVPVPAFTRAIEKHSMRAQGRARPPRPVAHRARAILCRHGQRRKPLINFAKWRNVGAALQLIVSGVRDGVC